MIKTEVAYLGIMFVAYAVTEINTLLVLEKPCSGFHSNTKWKATDSTYQLPPVGFHYWTYCGMDEILHHFEIMVHG